MSLEGKVVLVTGAATGIGAAVAAGFSAQGAHVCGLDVAWPAPDTEDGSLERLNCDVADEEMVRSCVTDIEARHGAVDVLVNNAALSGAVEPKPFEQITPDEWVRIVSNNTLAPFLCTRAVVPKMRERRYGRIVNLTSGTVFVGVPHVLAYVASKGAVAVMTKALAKELGSRLKPIPVDMSLLTALAPAKRLATMRRWQETARAQ